MIGAGVLSWKLDEEHLDRSKITMAVNRRGLIYDPVSVVLITHDSTVTAIGRLRKGDAVTTFERRITIDLLEGFDPLPFRALVSVVNPTIQDKTYESLKANGRVAPDIWVEIWAAISRCRPDMAEHIREIERNTTLPNALARDRRYEVTLLEREAVGLSLSLAGLERKVLDGWQVPPQPEPFLKNFRSLNYSEDNLIQQDLRHFGDWLKYEEKAFMVRFRDGERYVSVVNANRTPVEFALGVDLVYYNSQFDAYTLVQYKKFRKEPQRGKDGIVKDIWAFRPNTDHNLNAELSRMKRIHSVTPAMTADPNGYRLNPGPCYLKLCEPDMDLEGTNLATGMYLSLEYFGLLVDSPAVRGTRDGVVLTYENVERWLNNTDFIGLVQKGWIGSTGIASDIIGRFVQAGLESKRSVIMAVNGQFPSDLRQVASNDDLGFEVCDDDLPQER